MQKSYKNDDFLFRNPCPWNPEYSPNDPVDYRKTKSNETYTGGFDKGVQWGTTAGTKIIKTITRIMKSLHVPLLLKIHVGGILRKSSYNTFTKLGYNLDVVTDCRDVLKNTIQNY